MSMLTWECCQTYPADYKYLLSCSLHFYPLSRAAQGWQLTQFSHRGLLSAPDPGSQDHNLHFPEAGGAGALRCLQLQARGDPGPGNSRGVYFCGWLYFLEKIKICTLIRQLHFHSTETKCTFIDYWCFRKINPVLSPGCSGKEGGPQRTFVAVRILKCLIPKLESRSQDTTDTVASSTAPLSSLTLPILCCMLGVCLITLKTHCLKIGWLARNSALGRKLWTN